MQIDQTEFIRDDTQVTDHMRTMWYSGDTLHSTTQNYHLHVPVSPQKRRLKPQKQAQSALLVHECTRLLNLA